MIVVTGSTQGLGAAIARRAAALGAAGSWSPAATASAARPSATSCRATLFAADLAEDEAWRGDRPRAERFGRARRARQRGRPEHPRHARRHQRRAVGPAVRGQRARAVRADAGGRAAMRRAGRGGSIVNIITMASHGGAPELTALRGLQGRAGHADPQRRPPAAAGPDPRQRAQHRLDRHRGRARRADRRGRGRRTGWPRPTRAPRSAGCCGPTRTSRRWSPTCSATRRGWSPAR